MVETHLTLPSLRDGPLPLPPQAGGEGHFGDLEPAEAGAGDLTDIA
jgi:hypothetical protein